MENGNIIETILNLWLLKAYILYYHYMLVIIIVTIIFTYKKCNGTVTVT